MRNTIKVLWYVIISAMVLTMFVMVSAKVFAHGDGKCLTDADGNVRLSNMRLSNGGWVKIIDHLRDTDLDGFIHGHRDQYYDRHGNPTGQAKGFFDINFDDADSDSFADCPTAPPTPTLDRTPTKTDRSNPRSDADTDSHFWDFSEGDSQFIGLPVVPEGVKTIKDLWEAFRAEFETDISFKLMVDGVWQTTYQGEDNELGEIVVTPHLGINIGVGSWVTLRGAPVAGEQLELSPGVHFVGLPEIPMLYKRPSDLLNGKIVWVEVRKKVKRNGSPYYTIYAEGNEGDDLFYAGQAFVIRVIESIVLDLRNKVASAPMAQRVGTLATSWGSMKERQ